MISNLAGIMMAASEQPSGMGFAEQPGCSHSGMMCGAESSSDEATESVDDTDGILTAAPVGSHICLLKSISDVIVFGTNNCIGNMKCYDADYQLH